MFRRSRFSVRPNVSTGGRAAAASQETPSASQEAGETPRDANESNSATPVVDNKADLTTTEKSPAPGDGSDQTGEGSSSSAAVQRRKRFSIKPKVAPGRAALARAAKSPAKAVAETPGSGSDLDKPTTSSQATAAPQGLQSPRRRRPSEETKQPTIQPKPATLSSESSGLSSVPLAEDSLAETPLPGDSSKELEILSDTQVKEVPPRQPEVPPSLPDKEAIEISEKAKTLVSSKSLLSQTSSAFTLSRLLNDPSDLHRLAKAQKLRELLRKEMCKDKKLKKIKMFPKEYTLDPAKMTMSDLIRYLPTSNPMPSSLEDSAQENEFVVPPSPVREESPERAQEPEELPTAVSSREEGDEEAEEEDDDALMVPRVKVAEDGSLIIDEESLMVEVQRAKGPNPAQNRDPIFERGSTTTYSSFRKGTYSKPWSTEETDMFFLAINMVGTDFSMICQLFPHRARSEIKNKFKKEERENAWRIDKAFKERRKLDIEYFSKLLEKILEYQKNKKKLKSLARKNSPKKNKKKEKAVKKSAKKRDDVQEGGEANENQVPDLEKEGEKENEDLCNEGETPDSKPKRKRKTKTKADALTEEPDGKKKKTNDGSNEQGEAGIPEDAEAALPEDHQTNSDMSEKIQEENTDKDTSVKPAKLSRGRAPKPLLPLGRKWGKKPPPSTEEAKDTPSDKGDESVGDGASKEQANDASPLSQANMKKSGNDDISSEEEDATVKPLRPTRYGRVPKPTRLLNYPAKEDAHSSASETLPASPAGSTSSPARLKPKPTAKRAVSSKQQSAPKSKKPKLVTLRASQSESSDDEIETPWLNEELVEEQQLACSPGKDSSAPVFVPASLHTPQPVISEVDETMVELDILASMPDMLGMSQDGLCPNSSCEEAHEAGTAEPCEHQLDLLVDVIDFLSSEHTEVTEDESYNEAAQTLLTIGNLAHLSQSAQTQTVIQEDGTVTTSAAVDETSQLEEEIASKPVAQEGCDTTSVSTAAGQELTETSVASVELQNTITECGDMLIVNTSDPKCDEQKTVCDPSPQLHSEPECLNQDSPQAKKGRLSKVKPKPNLSRSSRTAQSKSQQETSAVRIAEESHSQASLSQASDALAAAEETTSKIPDCAPALVKDDVSCAAKVTDDSDSPRRLFDQAQSDAATADGNFSEIHSLCHSESQFDPSKDETSRDTKPASESSDEKQKSCIGTPDTGFSNPGTSDSAVIEFGQGSYTDSVPVQESSNKPPATEDLSLSQVGESEVGTAFQSRRGRLPKGRPKPNLPQTSRTARSKPHSSVEEDSGPTSSPTSHKESITEVEPQPTGTPTLKKENESTDPASPSKASLNLDSTLTATKEASTNEEKTACVELVNQLELGATTYENQELSKAPFEASKERETRDTGSTSECTDENLTSHIETISNNVVTPVSAATESQGGRGSNVLSGSVQEVGAMFVKPAEELTVRQEEGEGASACQPKRSRLQKVKPKPNLPQTTRIARSKPQSTKEVAEKDPISAPNPQYHKETIAEVEPQTTYSPTPEKESECADPSLVSKASLNLDPTLVSIDEVCTNEEKTPYVEPADEVELGAPEKQNFSEAQFLPSRELASIDTGSTSECTDKSLTSHVETSNNVETTDSAVTESQVGQGSDIVSGSVQEVGGHPAMFVKPAEELTVRQDEGDGASACQLRRSRLQKVKPKPNLPQMTRTARSKPQSTKEVVEKDPIPAPNPQFHKETTAEVEPQTTYSPTPEKESECADPSLVSKASLNLDSTLVSIEEVCTNEGKTAYVETADEVELGASEKQNFSEAQFVPSRELASIDTGSASECTNENLTSHVETIGNNVETTDSVVTESQVGQGSDIVSGSVQEVGGHPAMFVKPAEELTVCQEEGEGASACQPKRSRLQKVKPKPNLPQTTRTARSKPQSTKDQFVEKPHSPTSIPESTDHPEVEAQPTSDTTPQEKSSQIITPGPASVSVPSLDVCPTHKSLTKELSSAKELKTDVGCEPASSSVVSDQNVPQRKRWFPKVKPKPNLGSSTRTALTKMQSGNTTKSSEHKETTSYVIAENKVGDNNIGQTDLELTEKDIKHLTMVHCSFDAELSSINVGPGDCERVPDSRNDEVTSSGMVINTSRVAEKQSVLTESVLESKSTKKVETKSTQDKMSKNDPEEASPSSQEDNKLDTSTTESHTQQINDPTPVSDVESSKDESTASTTNANPVCLEKDSSVQSNETESELTDSKNSRKAPQARRGRLIKPKPNLVRAGRPPQPRKVQNTTAEEESSSCSGGVDASVDHKPVSELGPDIQQPVGKVIGELRSQDSPVSDAGSSLGCLAQVTKHQSEHDSPSNDAQASLGCVTEVSTTQSESTSSKEGIQSFPVLFQEMLPEQVPSDPNEPFFILSLTEIPVSSSGEVVSSASEHFSHLPVSDASIQQPGVSGESFAAGDGSFFYVPMEDSNMMDLINVKDTEPDLSTSIVPPMEHPVDPHGSVTAQPPKSPEAVDEGEITKQRRAGPGRTAKLQVKSRTARKKQTSKTETAEEGETVPSRTNAAQDSEHPGVSVQPEAFGLQKGSHVDADKKTGGKDPDTSSGAQTTQRTRTSVRNRKPKDFPSFLSETNNTAASSDPPPGKAASNESEGKTQHAESSLASESRAVSLTLPTKTELDLKQTSDLSPSSSNPSTSQGTAEASASQQSECVEIGSVEEEPTNVSQYFLSDIFTEVDEG